LLLNGQPRVCWWEGVFYYSFQNKGSWHANKPVIQVPLWCMSSWFFLFISSTCVLYMIMAEFKSKVTPETQQPSKVNSDQCLRIYTVWIGKWLQRIHISSGSKMWEKKTAAAFEISRSLVQKLKKKERGSYRRQLRSFLLRKRDTHSQSSSSISGCYQQCTIS
jgi:hypothetical protein